MSTHARHRFSFGEVGMHLRGLFATKKLAFSTSLIWFSWLLIGLAYPLYNVFLPQYLATRGAQTGAGSAYITWRNYALANFSSIPSPILAGYMCKSRLFWGRRGTMVCQPIEYRYFPLTIFSDHRGFSDHDFLLRLHSGQNVIGECRLYLCDQLLLEHLLRYALRIHT